jgi:acetate kinase
MGTRSGSVDPGMLLWLQTEAGLDAAEVLDALDRRSGLFGLCGSADVREVLAMAAAGNESAGLARDVYVHRIAASAAAMAASLGGLSAIAFTGGVGENSAEAREAVCTRLRFLGVEIDQAANRTGTGDRAVGAAAGDTEVLVIRSREDLTIAGEVRRMLVRV